MCPLSKSSRLRTSISKMLRLRTLSISSSGVMAVVLGKSADSGFGVRASERRWSPFSSSESCEYIEEGGPEMEFVLPLRARLLTVLRGMGMSPGDCMFLAGL